MMFKAKTGKQVEVMANGTSYKGILKAITEDEVYVKTALKTWALPLTSVRSIREIPEAKLSSSKVDPSKSGFESKTDPYGGDPKPD